MAKIVMTLMAVGGVHKVFYTQAELDASSIKPELYTVVDLPDADLTKVLNERARFKVTDNVLGVENVSPPNTYDKEAYRLSRITIMDVYYLTKEGSSMRTNLRGYMAVIEGIDVDSLTVDSNVSFGEYVRSINSGTFYHPLQIV